MLTTAKEMEYYKLQMTWVHENMKSSQSNNCTAVVSKKPDILMRSWAESYGSSDELSLLTGIPDGIEDYFIMQFGLRLKKTASVA